MKNYLIAFVEMRDLHPFIDLTTFAYCHWCALNELSIQGIRF